MQSTLRGRGVRASLSGAVLGRLAPPSLAVPATGLLLPSLQGPQPGGEPSRPGSEVGLDAAMPALDCVAVALPSGQHPLGAQQPQPFVNVRADLQEGRERERRTEKDHNPQTYKSKLQCVP